MNARRRLMAAALALAGWAATATPASAQQVIFLVRHAEKAAVPAAQPAAPSHSMLGDDPPLSTAGRQRAEHLAQALSAAGIAHVFTTEYKRTRETAEPLVKRLKLTPVMGAAKDPDPLVAELRRVQGNVLVVGHSNTVPDLLKRLGVTTPVTISDDEYDNLYVVFRDAAGKATLVTLKY